MFTTAPLFGKFHSPLMDATKPFLRRPLHHLETICFDRIDPTLLQPNETKANSRERIYTPKLTFLTFLDQVLNPDSSCRSAVDQVLSYYHSLPHYPVIVSDTSAYCQARARWTCDELIDIRRHLAGRMAIHGNTLLPGIPGQCPIKVIDGTCFNLPDTAANREIYPHSTDQKPGCGFPLVRMVGVFCLRTGVLLEETSAPYTTSENALFQDLWPTFQAGDLLLADRNFSSYASIASLKQQAVDCLFHLHASRKSDFRKGLRLGPRDRLITWTKPKNKPANLSQEQWQLLPATLTVRMVRIRLASAWPETRDFLIGAGREESVLTLMTISLFISTSGGFWPGVFRCRKRSKACFWAHPTWRENCLFGLLAPIQAAEARVAQAARRCSSNRRPITCRL